MTKQLWIFGYGSLLWDPGFDPAEAVQACAKGWHRSFCMRSMVHRGTPEAPGLVLALDAAEGAMCHGMGFAVRPDEEDRVIAKLRARELVTDAYLERRIALDLVDGRAVEAVTYVIDKAHHQYCDLPLAEQARIIAGATGGRGPNRDYLWNTARHLHEMGLNDPDLDWLAEEVRMLTA
ncbi:gamma-glutamylcyclotransferase [Pseudothioclava nitratireducens]|uniref:gamma-glutamylcyclotransferase n=1 Tax=Pseudothioclava nitratireducens TaxID=1928646 RepID=UPI0023DC7164|nr:gamma-glutamylcyclotransferase [Defluviimonas nitratireducens]MDF1621000.1 gamma-glutamylcyclotransferase [Defluviimonas nitratireducens]